jgi:hypothetical protein
MISLAKARRVTLQAYVVTARTRQRAALACVSQRLAKIGDSPDVSRQRFVDHHYMLKTRSLIFATAASLLGAGFVAASPATAGPVPCTTKKCVDQPPPRLCSTVQAELDQVVYLIYGAGPLTNGLAYYAALFPWLRNEQTIKLANATAASVQAQRVLADVIASAPAYADLPAPAPTAPSTGLVVTLDRRALWEQQLNEAQAEATRLAIEEAVALDYWTSLNDLAILYTAQHNDAAALRQALLGELKTCTYRGG